MATISDKPTHPRGDPHTYRVFQVDAFTDQLFAGNPAVVVLDADTLSDRQMQLIAREINTGDTAFVLSPQGSDHDLRVRFFTSVREVPYVGHATIAAHVVLARDSSGERRLRQLSGIGVVEVQVTKRPRSPEIAVRQPAAKVVRSLTDVELDTLQDALGVGSGDLDPRCPVEIYALRATRLLIGLKACSALANLKPDFGALARLTPHLGADGYFVFVVNEGAACLTEARMFCPAIGIPEDAVSGNAHGMLGAYLVRHGLLRLQAGRASFSGAQGAALGRPGLVNVEIEAEGQVPQTVRIAGTGVIVFETQLTF
jgi:PhzF family phenazine biosynthesis protein